MQSPHSKHRMRMHGTPLAPAAGPAPPEPDERTAPPHQEISVRAACTSSVGSDGDASAREASACEAAAREAAAPVAAARASAPRLSLYSTSAGILTALAAALQATLPLHFLFIFSQCHR
eukprot:1963635-Pleurochrysis_carterae.AAC.3